MQTASTKTMAGSLKGMFTKVVVGGTLAGAMLFAAPKSASAQGFSVQFGVGQPYAREYNGPVYERRVYPQPAYGFYADRRREFEAERRHEEWERHERWDRDRRFDGRRDGDGFYGR